MMSKAALRTLIEGERERVITPVQVYAPTETSPDSSRESFYRQL